MFSMSNTATSKNQPSESIYDIKINALNGESINLSEFKGKYILFVNVASKCGFTGQYEDLQKLYDTYQDQLMIIGVPCNQFGGQEPGSASEIQTFCEKNYGVSFLLTEKVDVKGKAQHPLYQWLTDKNKNSSSSSKVQWNFQKYLVGKTGELIGYYLSTSRILSSKITKHLK
ncbi:glutathione peroxidase [Geojedonia litorea]|uniref:Glutathione peroxidase n=1 Tax=Geojedonia litorea TaxID=1268269 RepID=A0ABV9N2E9_9FLAO